jgi:hypothetical protein
MFDNYKEMSADEKAQVKKIHQGIRAETSSRSGNLAWGFIRGFPYRRIERKTRTQELGDGKIVVHNLPNPVSIARIIVTYIPSLEAEWFTGKYSLKQSCPILAWLADLSGAIAASALRPRKPYVRPTEQVA